MSETQNKSETKVWPLLNNFLQVAFNKTDISTCIKLITFAWKESSKSDKIKHINVKRKFSYAFSTVRNFANFLLSYRQITKEIPGNILANMKLSQSALLFGFSNGSGLSFLPEVSDFNLMNPFAECP